MINIDNKKINSIKLGANNYKRAYVKNDLVFRQGKWVFYKHETAYSASSRSILAEHLDYKDGGNFIIMKSKSNSQTILIKNNNQALFSFGSSTYDNEAYAVEIRKISSTRHRARILYGKFDRDSLIFYDSSLYEEDVEIRGYGINATTMGSTSSDLDIYKWQEV